MLRQHPCSAPLPRTSPIFPHPCAALAPQAGIGFGILVTVGACCIACGLRRYRKKMVRKPARAYMEYGPQVSDGPVSAEMEIAGVVH